MAGMRVLVIGRGGMGKLFARVMADESREFEFIGHGDKNLVKKTANSDVIVLATPTSSAKLLSEKLKKTKPGLKLIICLWSYMQAGRNSVESLSAPVVYLHFLFGPDIQFVAGQNIVVAGDYKNKLFKGFGKTLSDNQARIHHATPKFHDKIMAYTQSLSQYSSIMLGLSLAKSGYKYSELQDYASLTFRLNRYTIERIMRQKTELWSELQFENENYKPVLREYLKMNEKMVQAIETRDEKLFADIFDQAAGFWRGATANAQQIPDAVNQPKFSADSPADFVTLGPAGTYSNFVVEAIAKNGLIDFAGSIEEVLNKVDKGLAKKAVVPIENSLQGAVSETLDGLYRHKLVIEDEISIDIHHCMCALERPANKKQVRIIYSHPQALGQCAGYLAKNYPDAKLVPTASTVAGMQAIVDQKDLFALAIGPKYAAEKYHLAVIAENIEDKADNVTRFVVCSKKPGRKTPLKTTLIAVIPKVDRPGLLHDILEIIKDEGVNMSQIDSRPNRDEKDKYMFYLRLDILSSSRKFKSIVSKIEGKGVQVRKMSVDSLSRIRKDIDKLDREIIDLLARRKEVINQVIEFKKQNKIASLQPKRRDQVATNWRRFAKEKGLNPDVAEKVWTLLHDYFVGLEQEVLKDKK